MEVVLVFQVLLEGCVGVIPFPEIVTSAPDLLGPYACRMGVEREVRIGRIGLTWLGRLARNVERGRMAIGQSDISLAKVTVFTAGAVQMDRPFHPACTDRNRRSEGFPRD